MSICLIFFGYVPKIGERVFGKVHQISNACLDRTRWTPYYS